MKQLSGDDTSSVNDMSYMFSNCTFLTNLDLGNWNTSNVTDMSYMFNNSKKLKHIYVGENWNTEANTEETFPVFLSTCELSNFSSSNPNYRDLSYAHTGEGGYLTLKTD